MVILCACRIHILLSLRNTNTYPSHTSVCVSLDEPEPVDSVLTFPSGYDTLEYSWVKATAVSVRLQILFVTLQGTNIRPGTNVQTLVPVLTPRGLMVRSWFDLVQITEHQYRVGRSAIALYLDRLLQPSTTMGGIFALDQRLVL